jgi:hypothetical protein
MRNEPIIFDIQENEDTDRATEINRFIEITRKWLFHWQNYQREFAKKLDQKISKLYLESCIIWYEESSNPLYFWRAFKFAKEKGLNIPHQIVDYLYKIAGLILQTESKPNYRATWQLGKALALTDGHFAKFHNDDKKIRAYELIEKWTAEGKHSNKTECFAEAAKVVNCRKNDSEYDGVGTGSKWYYGIREKMKEPLIFRKIKIHNKKE